MLYAAVSFRVLLYFTQCASSRSFCTTSNFRNVKKRIKIVASRGKLSASTGGGVVDGVHKKDRRIAGDTADKETGQLLQ
jgi:hypothetical protein